MSNLKNNKGFILILCYVLIVSLALLGAGYYYYAINESKLTRRNVYFNQAFYLAETGIDQALKQLRSTYSWNSGFNNQALGSVGTYSVVVTTDGNYRKLVSTGKVATSPSSTINYVIEAYAGKTSSIPESFFNYEIYGAKDLKLCNVTVNGNVIYADKIKTRKETVINGTTTSDDNISPLTSLDFASLKALSQSQGNYYDKDRLKDVKQGSATFPSSFWYDQQNQIPNVIYCESDLHVKGNFGTIAGFFLVVGNVVSKDEDTADTHIHGQGIIQGAIYTNGKLHVHAESHDDKQSDDDAAFDPITINGNLWVGKDTHIHKNVTLTYNSEYINAIKNLSLGGQVQIVSWRKSE
jgi:hypothetical protein